MLTGKKILSAIEQTSQKIDVLQSDMIELKQETAITNALIKASKDLEDIGIFDANHRGEITWVNSYFLKIMGVQREDMLKNRWHEYIDANHKSAVVKVWKDKVVEGDKIYIKTVFVDYMGKPVFNSGHNSCSSVINKYITVFKFKNSFLYHANLLRFRQPLKMRHLLLL